MESANAVRGWGMNIHPEGLPARKDGGGGGNRTRVPIFSVTQPLRA
jgi:hypothetical protein